MDKKDLDGLILNLFNKLINSDIYNIVCSRIEYKINNEDVSLLVFYRSKKEPRDNKVSNLEDLIGANNLCYLDYFDTKSNNNLYDFYIDLKGKQYRVPRPPLKTYAEWVDILESKIQQYELDLLTKLTKN